MQIHSFRHNYNCPHTDDHGHCRHGQSHEKHQGCQGEGKHRGRGRGRGKGLRRLFDHGDLHIMVLSLVAKNQATVMKLSNISKKHLLVFISLVPALFIPR